MLVYYSGVGQWFQLDDVDSVERQNALRTWVINNKTSPDWTGEELDRYNKNVADWKKNNPPPNYFVTEEGAVRLEQVDTGKFFDFQPTLSVQYVPGDDKKNYRNVFKLKEVDARELRYKKVVTLSTLLPCTHPDGCKEYGPGDFFQIDGGYTFTTDDIVPDVFSDGNENTALPEALESDGIEKKDKENCLDEEKPDLDGINVIFSGHGYWITDISSKETEDNGRPYFSCTRIEPHTACGIFDAGRSGEIEYRHTKTLKSVDILYPCSTHSDKVVPPELDWDEIYYENSQIAAFGDCAEDFSLSSYFRIDRSYDPWTLEIAQPDKPTQTEGINGECSQADYEPATTDAIQDGTTSTELELTQWLRDTWINEGKPGGTAFFRRLKKYVNQKGSPIVDHYSAGTEAGFKWKTSAGTTGETKKKTILTKVSLFKKTP